MKSASPAVDPSLDALVPRSSRRRDIMVVFAAVALLILVGWLGVYGRVGATTAGWSAALQPDRRVVLMWQLETTGVPGLRATALTAPAGTRLTGAWLIPLSHPLAQLDRAEPYNVEALQRTEAGEFALPAAAGVGDFQLVAVLEISDCATFAVPTGEAEGPVDTDGPVAPSPTLTLRTALGASAGVELPGTGWTAAELAEYAGCAL